MCHEPGERVCAKILSWARWGKRWAGSQSGTETGMNATTTVESEKEETKPYCSRPCRCQAPLQTRNEFKLNVQYYY